MKRAFWALVACVLLWLVWYITDDLVSILQDRNAIEAPRATITLGFGGSVPDVLELRLGGLDRVLVRSWSDHSTGTHYYRPLPEGLALVPMAGCDGSVAEDWEMIQNGSSPEDTTSRSILF